MSYSCLYLFYGLCVGSPGLEGVLDLLHLTFAIAQSLLYRVIESSIAQRLHSTSFLGGAL